MNEPSLINDCFLHDKDRLRHDEAIALLRGRMVCVVGQETIDANDGLGRVLAHDILARHAVPLHTNSAVDGYAFDHRTVGASPTKLSGRVAAGDLSPPPLVEGTAVRIFTGAAMPEGADTVAMQEDCHEENGTVVLPEGLKRGANCRLAGEDLSSGDLVLEAGRRLRAADLAALASIGLAQLPVHKRLQVALFSSGNEMRTPGERSSPLRPGEVYDANQPLIQALAAPLPIDLHHGGILEDDANAVETAFKKASKDYDVILTTGGASKGAEDHMLDVLDRMGKRHLWQLAVKPGRPMMFGQFERPASGRNCLFFGLPGNPVAAMVCFLLYTRPALLALAGAEWEDPHRFALPADFSIEKKKPDRREFLRGILMRNEDSSSSVRKFERDGSGIISSLREADGLIEIPEDVTKLAKGSLVNFIPFSSFL